MEPNKQDGGAGAASSLPSDADFEGYYAHAMQFGVFGDPSSSQQQPPHRAAASSTPLNPPQLLAQPLLPPQAPSYGGGELYSGGHIRGLAYGPWRSPVPAAGVEPWRCRALPGRPHPRTRVRPMAAPVPAAGVELWRCRALPGRQHRRTRVRLRSP
ncbi:hypothetical protein HU200_003853 [Digitaria exilis]|uniref:Uncharacterized protein n=1 Tax=Digitaria exilis TaxID=1010633 RepID=A0A835FUS4_9POAL|nr:hypothetical protein HU200_003853 [Digitaria exilis]